MFSRIWWRADFLSPWSVFVLSGHQSLGGSWHHHIVEIRLVYIYLQVEFAKSLAKCVWDSNSHLDPTVIRNLWIWTCFYLRHRNVESPRLRHLQLSFFFFFFCTRRNVFYIIYVVWLRRICSLCFLSVWLTILNNWYPECETIITIWKCWKP